MKQPKQLPAVDRGTTKCTSIPAGTKVKASDFWGSLGQAAPGIIAGLGSLF